MGLQDLLALTLVAIATAYLLREAFRFTARKKGCAGGCPSCPSSSSAAEPQLVMLDIRPPSSVSR